uniref:White collar-1 n=2 Tax=Monilinia laxa TaxID=61186 RepID=A0A8D9PHC1_MONLA|nr:TPA_exp: white collar-1 [Monilinia laxa]
MTQADLQRQVAERRAHSRSASIPRPQQQQSSGQHNPNSMNMNGAMTGGDSLDDIIMQNSHELQRRQSYSQAFSPDNDRRSSSMLEFGNSDSNLNSFQFGTPTPVSENPMLRRQSTGELDLGIVYGNMGAEMNMQMPQMGYSDSVQPSPMTMDTSVGFPGFTGDMVPGMMSYVPLGMEGMSQDSSMGMYSGNNYSPSIYGNDHMDSMDSDFMMGSHDGMRTMSGNMNDENDETRSGLSVMVQSPANDMGISQNVVDYNSPSTSNIPPNLMSRASSTTTMVPPNTSFVSTPPVTSTPAPGRQAVAGIYSSTGFDMLAALMRVVRRKNKVIDIGAVDLSCAFVVCDLREADCPIIYVSDVFERLTGYSKHEVLGRNCRFLQSPDGKIQAGERRLDTENSKVYELKKAIDTRTETQQAIINYRKGGQPFMNLLTMIPIPATDDETELSLVVGFQVDVVANPNSIDSDTTGGNYTMNYKQGTLPRYVWQPPQQVNRLTDGGQTISRDDVSSVLASYDNGSDPELTKRMWDKVLLENTDDVVHVLSLKGLFLYLSPSCRQVLEYDSSELIGTALSSVCHPSDIVPVTRELKETSQGTAVNVVFRIRRKNSGYTWFESHGSLCVEQGKGRKCIVMVGRERPVYALARSKLNRSEGFGETELFSKLSTSGMFLFVSSHVRSLLDRMPEDLIGTSIQALMRSESKVEFGRALEKARTGRIVSYRHELFNKRGVVLQAETTLYPGDATEGQKPTFIVAQTRFAKSSARNVAPAIGANGTTIPGGKAMIMSPTMKKDVQSSDGSSSNHHSSRAQIGPFTEAMTPGSNPAPIVVTQSGGCGLPIGSQDEALASEDNIFDELKTTRCTSWQYELRQMEKNNRLLAEELASLVSAKKKRKRRKGAGNSQRDCVNCHTKSTPEWRRGPSGNRDLCNSCGLRWAKMQGRISSRGSKRSGSKDGDASSRNSNSPIHSSPLQNELSQKTQSMTPNLNISPGNANTQAPGPMNIKRSDSIGSVGSQGNDGAGGNVNKGSIGHGSIGVGGISNGGIMGGGTAVPASLGGRTTMESQPVHARSLGFNEGGISGITNIEEGGEGSGTSSMRVGSGR